jgi:hypothetical protein
MIVKHTQTEGRDRQKEETDRRPKKKKTTAGVVVRDLCTKLGN